MRAASSLLSVCTLALCAGGGVSRQSARALLHDMHHLQALPSVPPDCRYGNFQAPWMTLDAAVYVDGRLMDNGTLVARRAGVVCGASTVVLPARDVHTFRPTRLMLFHLQICEAPGTRDVPLSFAFREAPLAPWADLRANREFSQRSDGMLNWGADAPGFVVLSGSRTRARDRAKRDVHTMYAVAPPAERAAPVRAWAVLGILAVCIWVLHGFRAFSREFDIPLPRTRKEALH